MCIRDSRDEVVDGVAGGAQGTVGHLGRALRHADEDVVDDQELADPAGQRARPERGLPSGGDQHMGGHLGERRPGVVGDRHGGRPRPLRAAHGLEDVGGLACAAHAHRDVAGPQQHGARQGQVRVGERVGGQPDAQELL